MMCFPKMDLILLFLYLQLVYYFLSPYFNPLKKRKFRYLGSILLIRSPIHLITGTAILFPSALYLGPSGHLSLMSVYPSGNPCNLSHSIWVNLLTLITSDLSITPILPIAPMHGDLSPLIGSCVA